MPCTLPTSQLTLCTFATHSLHASATLLFLEHLIPHGLYISHPQYSGLPAQAPSDLILSADFQTSAQTISVQCCHRRSSLQASCDHHSSRVFLDSISADSQSESWHTLVVRIRNLWRRHCLPASCHASWSRHSSLSVHHERLSCCLLELWICSRSV